MKGFSLFFDFIKRFFSKMDSGASILADYFSFNGVMSAGKAFLLGVFYSFFFYLLVRFITDVSSFLTLLISIIKTFFNDFNNLSTNQNSSLNFFILILKSTGILSALNFCLNIFLPYYLFLFYLLFFKHTIRSTYYFKDFVKVISVGVGKINLKPKISLKKLRDSFLNTYRFKD